MWPSDIVPELLRDHPLRQRCTELVRRLFDDDSFEFDFGASYASRHTSAPPNWCVVRRRPC
jgi:hypothetical protein